MLAELLAAQRAQVIDRAVARILERTDHEAGERAVPGEVIARLLEDIIVALRAGRGADGERRAMGDPAGPAHHAALRYRMGFALADLVWDYGDLCTAITQIAEDAGEPVGIVEFRILNQCVDGAIAAGVTEYVEQRDSRREDETSEQVGLIAHELRNALNAAVVAFDMLRKGQLSLKGRTAEVVARSQLRLRGLIDKLLANARLASGAFQKRCLRAGELIEEIVDSARPDAEAHEVRLRVEADPELTLEGDHLLLVSVLGNLTQNAIKFSHRGGEVVLRASSQPHAAHLEVEDSCGGLPEGSGAELFEPFVQRGHDRSGFGLGLTLVQRAVEAHQGKLMVHNFPGKGCVFAVEIPAR